jgi:hypothetical protein
MREGVKGMNLERFCSFTPSHIHTFTYRVIP